jgi:hypothetical protein
MASGAESANSPQWSRSMLVPFEPGPNFGNFTGSRGSGMGFNAAERGISFGRQGAGSLIGFGEPAMAEQQNRFASRVQMSGSVPRGVRSSANGTFSATSAAPPSFNQLMRGNSGLRLNSNFGAQRFSSQNTFRPIGNFGDPGLPSASALFTSSDLGNGVFLSAGTGYGNHSTAGAPAASLGNGTSGGQKHSGASLALKLSF